MKSAQRASSIGVWSVVLSELSRTRAGPGWKKILDSTPSTMTSSTHRGAQAQGSWRARADLLPHLSGLVAHQPPTCLLSSPSGDWEVSSKPEASKQPTLLCCPRAGLGKWQAGRPSCCHLAMGRWACPPPPLCFININFLSSEFTWISDINYTHPIWPGLSSKLNTLFPPSSSTELCNFTIVITAMNFPLSGF